MKEIIKDKIIEIINLYISNGTVVTTDQDNENLSELGMNSITFIQIVVALEEEFECEIPDEKLLIAEMNTVKKIADILQMLYDNQCE